MHSEQLKLEEKSALGAWEPGSLGAKARRSEAHVKVSLRQRLVFVQELVECAHDVGADAADGTDGGMWV